MDKIAVLGPKDTYSDEASKQFMSQIGLLLQVIYYDDVKTAVNSVMLDNQYAVLPFENTLDGYIGQHMDLLVENHLSIVKELLLKIEFDYVSLCDKPKRLYVQYVTKNQCQAFIKKLGDIEIITTESNILSLHKALKDSESAAIIPSHISNRQTFVKQIKQVTDISENYTRFLIVEKKSVIKIASSHKLKVTLVITVKNDKPGLLYEILSEFAKREISLISIMSRPTKKEIGKYHFFMELLIVEQKEDMLNKIDAIRALYDINIIGIYEAYEKNSN